MLAGTGSIALARSADGREGRAGGWGYLLGDEGGGYWLGREAITAYLGRLEGRAAAGVLLDLVAEAVGPSRPDRPRSHCLGHAAASHVARLASLAPLVSRAADGGDPVALDILTRAAQALADLAGSAARQLWPRPSRPPCR